MKKILLLFALIMTVGAVNAGKIKQYAKFTDVGSNNNITWDGSSNTVTIKGIGANTYQIFSFSAGTLSKYKTINLNVSEKNGIAQVMFKNGSGWIYWEIESTGATSKTLSEISGLTPEIIAACTEIRLTGQRSGTVAANYTYTIDPNSVYLETEDVECMSITTTLNSSSTKDAPFAWTNRSYALDNKLGTELTSNGNVLSYTAGSLNKNNGYINLTGYDRAVVNFTKGATSTTLRMIYSDGTNAGNKVIETKVTSTAEQMFETLYNTDFISLKANTSKLTVNTIDFIKDFDAASTTAFNIAASSSSTVNYDRAFTAGEKYTICLPFALTTDQVLAAGEFYELSSVSDDVLNFNKVTDKGTEAYKPYIFVPSSTGKPFANLSDKEIAASSGATTTTKIDSYTFKGVLAATEDVMGDNEGYYVYGFRASDGTFVKVTGNSISVKAFRAYITVQKPMVPEPMDQSKGGYSFMKASFGGGDGTTAIKKVETVSDDDPNAPVYNLAGQQVDASYKGIVIKNGKKYFQNK